MTPTPAPGERRHGNFPNTTEFQRRFILGLEDGLRDVGEALGNESNKIIRGDAFDEGTLHGSKELRPAEGVFKNGDELRIEVAWTAEHSIWVYFGTRPHWPPLAPILAWVKRNFRIVATAEGGVPERIGVFKPRLKKGTVKARPDEALEVARAIQRKIAREGTKALPWASMAASRVAPRVGSIMHRAINKRMRGLRGARGGNR